MEEFVWVSLAVIAAGLLLLIALAAFMLWRIQRSDEKKLAKRIAKLPFLDNHAGGLLIFRDILTTDSSPRDAAPHSPPPVCPARNNSRAGRASTRRKRPRFPTANRALAAVGGRHILAPHVRPSRHVQRRLWLSARFPAA